MDKVVYCWKHNGDPFYIGMGDINRAYSKHGRNQYCRRKRAKAEREGTFEIIILYEGLTTEQAYAKEQETIALFGRFSNGGCLTNMTDGGEGSLNPSPETRNKLRKAKLGKPGNKLNDEQRAANSNRQKGEKGFWFGKKHTNKTKKKNAKSQPDCKRISTPFGIFFSCGEAERQTGINRPTISYRCKSSNFTDWYFMDE